MRSVTVVIPTPAYTCDDGSEAQAISGRPLEEQLRNLTFVLEAERDTLTDNFGGIWLREGTEAPSPAPQSEPTTAPAEDGQPVAVPYSYFEGELIVHAAHPWVFHDGWPGGRLIPEGPDVPPTTDGGERADWDELVLIADPALGGTGCQTGPDPADAGSLAESIRSYPGLEAEAPVAVSAGGAEGLMMDVVIAAGTTMTVTADEQGNLCDHGLLNPVFDTDAEIHIDDGVATGIATGEMMRLYLFNAPGGLSMRTLAVAIVAPESRFERAVESAAPIIDSIEFHSR
jgi:hypothetical protein